MASLQILQLQSKKSALFIFGMLALFVLVFDSYYSKVIITDYHLNHIIRLRNRIFDIGILENPYNNIVVSENESLINTPGCVLPRTELLPKGFAMKFKDHDPKCDFEKRLVYIDDRNEILNLTEDGRNSERECKVKQINRHSSEDTFLYGDEFKMTESLDISDKELFITKCGKYINFDAHFPVQKEVQSKIKFWEEKQKNKNELPINVLLVGFDTVSRLHFHRSLQRTLPFMTKMGFIDFKGFHSSVPYTLENLLSFLTGLEIDGIRRSCAESWSSPFDECPLIWKTFNSHKFVTTYIEDGDQSFNWGGQSGFIKKPTDYYPHPLFESIKHYRQKFNKEQDHSCLSTMNAPHFLLDYTTRFIQKFKNTPFFSFTWFAYPFHRSTYSLYGFDDKMAEFFEFLNSEEYKETLERTLIIVTSDHGERHGDFMKTAAYEGYMERSLPGLFIRVPENLHKLFPEVNLTEVLQFNSEQRLTSGFDIHHTLLHVLDKQGLKFSEENKEHNKSNFENEMEFQPVFNDRSSLFLPVSDQRTCDDIHVVKGYCVCSKRSGQNSAPKIEIPLISNKLVSFAIDELNAIVQNSKYKEVCEMHRKPTLSFLSSNVLDESDTYTDIVLQFITDLNAARFEVQLRIVHEKTTMDNLERLGPFNRLNLYGDSSWCVEFVTDEDKRMKEICQCKKKKPAARI